MKNNYKLDDSLINVLFDENGKVRSDIHKKSTSNYNINVNNIEKKKYTKKQLISAIIASIVISTSVTSIATISITNQIESIQNDNKLDTILKDYQEIINKSVDAAAQYENLGFGKQGKINGYDASIIADNINTTAQTTEDKDILIYTLYKNYGKKEGIPEYNNITNNTLKYIKDDDNINYKGLDDYITKKGFDNKEDYDKKMENMIISLYEAGKDISMGGR